MRLIDADALVDVIEGTDWYHYNQLGEMVHGANSQEHAPFYKASDIYDAIKNAPTIEPCEDAISRAELIERLEKDPLGRYWLKHNNLDGLIKAIPSVAPSVKTKHIRYFDEEEKVWKIGEVIDDE